MPTDPRRDAPISDTAASDTPASEIVCGMGGDAVVALRARERTRTILAANFDLDAVLLFVILGRGSHGEGGSWVAETAKVAASFLIGLAVAWLVARAWTAPWAVRTGAIVWAATLGVGIALRPVFGRSVQVSFVVVTALFLALFLIGWRVVAGWWARRRTPA